MRVAAGRRHLRRGDGVAGLRPLQRADRSRARGDHDDGPDHRPAAAGRRAQRSLRPAAHHGHRRRRARARRRAPGAALADRRARAVAHRGDRGGLRRRDGVLQPLLRRARARGAACRRPRAGQRAGPVRAADRAAPGRAGAGRRAHRGARGRHGLRGRRGVLRRLGGRAAGDGARRARPGGRGGGQRHGRHRGGPALHPQPRVAVGDVRQRRDRLPALHGAGRGAAALHRQERPARIGRGPRDRLRRGRYRLGGLRRVPRPARTAPARHHLHVRHVDAGHAGRRRLRPVHRGVAAR